MSDVQVKGGPSPEDQAQAAANAADDFLEYYLQHQIYFDQTLCDTLYAFNQKMHQAWVAFNMSKSPLVDPGAKRHESLQAAWKAISEELPEIRKEIESSSRSILGPKPQ